MAVSILLVLHGERHMIITTGNEVSGHAIDGYLGIVRGIVVRTPSIAQGFIGGLKSIAGGNIEEYAQVCEAARREAFERMMQHAAQLGADAIIGMRYDATEFSDRATEVLAYGTAVQLSATTDKTASVSEIEFVKKAQ